MIEGHHFHSPIVIEAAAMICTQAFCSLDRALELLRETAETTHETVKYVAGEVLAGRVRFDSPS
jgi:hypothetical protein